MYEIASRYGIEEPKTYANLMIHRTLAIASARGFGGEELVRLIRPIYDIHLPPTDRLIPYLLRRIQELRGNFTNEQKRRIRELEYNNRAFGYDRRGTAL